MHEMIEEKSVDLGEADRLLQAGLYQKALDLCLKGGEVALEYRNQGRNHMLTALGHTLDLICVNVVRSEGSGDSESEGRCEDFGYVDWEDFSKLAQRMYSLYKDDDVAMTMLGVKCLDEGMHEQAEFFLNSAIIADQESLVAKENLRVLFDRMVQRWHFHMLNDIQRNSAYSKAIHLAVKALSHCTVLDIGSGTGILSMMAVHSGAEMVYGVEVNSTMVSMSQEILSYNNITERVKLIQSLSTSLSIPRDIPGRVNLVVTEIVDAGLLGENIIPTLRHAWKELLLHPNSSGTGGCVIPSGATVYAVVIECPEIRRNSRLMSTKVADMSMGAVKLLGSCKINNEGSCSNLEREIYSCERLNNIRGGFKSLTSAQPILHFDFTQPEIPLPKSDCFLKVTHGGKIDAVAVWFDLHLFSDVFFSTSPSWDLSWEQAIFSVPEEKTVEEGDSLLLHATCSDTSLFMEVELLEKPQAKSNEDLKHREVFYVERSDLLRLNDSVYVSSYQQAMVQALATVKKEKEEEEESSDEDWSQWSEFGDVSAKCLLLDMTHGLSLFGLSAAKSGADFVLMAQFNPTYKSLIEILAGSNEVADLVSVRHYQDMRKCHPKLMWDIVVCDVVSPQGNLQEGVFEKIAHIRSAQCCTGLIIPSKIIIEAVLISSPFLRAQSSVLGTVPTLGLEIAPFINHYQVTHFIDSDLGAFPVAQLSNTFQVMEIDLNTLDKTPLKLNSSVEVEVKSDGTICGIGYWFNFHLYGDITLTTAPRGYSESHWHQCVFMLPQDMTVSKGEKVIVNGLLRDSCIDMSLTKPSLL